MSKGASTRTRVLEVALAEGARKGLSALSIGDLASASGLSKSGLFAHFGGVDRLQTAIVEAAVEHFTQEVVAPARAESVTAAERLESLARRWTDWLADRDKPRICPLLQAGFDWPAFTAPAAERARDARREFVAYLERKAKEAIEAGEFRADADPAAFAFRFEGIGAATASYAAIQGRPDAAAQARAAFEDLMKDYRR